MKNTEFMLEPPSVNYHLYNRLVSNRNVVYYKKEAHVDVPLINIDEIDKNLRILGMFLISQDFQIHCFQAIQLATDQEWEGLYSNVKNDEKEIRKDGITIYDIAQRASSLRNKNYRIKYPSYDAFKIDYALSIQKQFITFAAPRNKKTEILYKSTQSFDNALFVRHELDKIIFTLTVDASETSYSDALWRRYTQNLVKIIANPQTSNKE